MSARQVLPAKRPHLVFEFEHDGHRYTVGVGSFLDARPAEVFLNASKSGTMIETYARDGAVLLSLLLQHGCPVDTAQHAITRNRDGSPAGPLGALLDLLAQEGGRS
jgi:hypothetical protein